MNSKDILRLLAERHSDAVFVPECKDGPTYGANHLRFDAWVLKRSWAKPATIGYEIKVSRSDFMRDDKWPGYLPLCNELYFVCPFGLISKGETPESCGLMYVTKNGERLRIIKKAPWRDVEIPDSIFRYVLMIRAEIVDDSTYKPCDMATYWRDWLVDRERNSLLGRSVSKKLQARVEERIYAVERENDRLIGEISKLGAVKKELEALGINYTGYCRADGIARQVRAARAAIPLGLPADLVRVAEQLKEILSMPIEKAENIADKALREQGHKKGLAAVMGKWPGDATDEEVDAALEEIS